MFDAPEAHRTRVSVIGFPRLSPSPTGRSTRCSATSPPHGFRIVSCSRRSHAARG